MPRHRHFPSILRPDVKRRRPHLAALAALLVPALSTLAAAQGSLEAEVDRKGFDYRSLTLAAPQAGLCQTECINDPACRSWTFVRPGLQGPAARCWLKFNVPRAVQNPCCSSGVVRPTADVEALLPRSQGRRLAVVPVLFIPSDNTALTPEVIERDSALFIAHLVTTQKFYRNQLEDDTFKIAGSAVMIHRARHSDAYYTSRLRPQKGEADAAHVILTELFAARNENRNNSQSIYVVLYARTQKHKPDTPFFGGGRTFNGAPGSGGGSLELELSSLASDFPYSFQAALIHELGHTFGLVHVDCFGYDQNKNESVMSYDKRWGTHGLSISPGRLNPEDFFLLGQNKLAFPHFRYDAAKHDPKHQRRHNPACKLGSMTSHIGLKANGAKCLVYPCP